MTAYYNEVDDYAADWLENLIAAGHIAPGDVDRRSIVDVRPADVRGYRQCHFFAGIGGWSHALRLAGWPDDREVWTGSPPCQNTSVAGAVWGVRSGLRGERSGLAHCWLDLVEAIRPATVSFENVPGIAPWLAEITDRLASARYAISKRKRSVADIGGPHQRRRVWIIADANGTRLPEPWESNSQETDGSAWRTAPGDVWVAAPGRAVGMADGFPARVDAVRAYGNAIVPQVAAEFVGAFMLISQLELNGA